MEIANAAGLACVQQLKQQI